MLTQTIVTSSATPVVAKNAKSQITPEEVIKKATKNWKVVVLRHLEILGPEKSAALQARWKSALTVERVEARARFMRETVYAAADLLAPKVLALADAQLSAEERQYGPINWARDLLSDAEGSKHSLGRLVLADVLLYRLEILPKARKSLGVARFVANKKIAPQIDGKILKNHFVRAEEMIQNDPVGAMEFLNNLVWPLVNELVKKSNDVPQTCVSRAGKTARKAAENHRRQAAHQQERAAACSKAMKGGASKTKK